MAAFGVVETGPLWLSLMERFEVSLETMNRYTIWGGLFLISHVLVIGALGYDDLVYEGLVKNLNFSSRIPRANWLSWVSLFRYTCP